MTDDNHARDNASGWNQTLKDYYYAVRALQSGYALEGLDEDDQELVADAYRAMGAPLPDGDRDCDDIREEIEEHARENALCVEVRSGWASLGETMGADEYRITLTFGGPSLELVGDLENCEPSFARLIYCDQSTPRTEYLDADHEALMWFASLFYFDA